MKRSLIWADPRDIHALRVQERSLKVLGHPCSIVASARFPASLGLGTAIDGTGCRLHVDHEGDRFGLDEVSGIWRRRLWRHEVSAELETSADREISRNDSRHALEGFLHLGANGVRTMNDPRFETAAESKPFQLATAAACGLRIPETCISNDPQQVIAFVDAQREQGHRVAYKTFASPSNKFIATKVFDDDDAVRLTDLRFAPAIFQTFVEGRDVRLTYVGGTMFAAEIHPRSDKSRVDWRIDGITQVSALAIDAIDGLRIHALMERLGLSYGALDFKLCTNGELVFLEVNPWGQYLFVEIQTGQEISLAIAHWLAASD